MSEIKKIRVNLGSRSYEIVIGKRILPKLPIFLKNLNLGSSAVIITNSRIKRKMGARVGSFLKKHSFALKFFLVPDSEKAKSAKVAFGLIQKIASFDVKKKIFIIAMGGGVIGDLAGYVAATYKRGIPYVQLPTTFLSQIDSSIGGKVGIDLVVGKNLVGAFYQPRLVFSDVSVLSSLSLRQIRSGLAEAIKYAVIKDRLLFEFLERSHARVLKMDLRLVEEIVLRCSKIKARIVEADEKEEKGLRTLLNFGHTVGHAIEAGCGYKFYTHGEAIALGMICSSRLAQMMGILDNSDVLRLENLLSKVGLPVKIRRLRLAEILAALEHDKKFIAGKKRFVLPEAIGRAGVYDGISLKLIKSAINERIRT